MHAFVIGKNNALKSLALGERGGVAREFPRVRVDKKNRTSARFRRFHEPALAGQALADREILDRSVYLAQVSIATRRRAGVCSIRVQEDASDVLTLGIDPVSDGLRRGKKLLERTVLGVIYEPCPNTEFVEIKSADFAYGQFPGTILVTFSTRL